MTTTHHEAVRGEARDLAFLDDRSVHLIVTSPPYPMIAMWDEVFSAADTRILEQLSLGDGLGAFEAMHATLDPVWEACHRVLAPGGLLCINVGDATRTVDSEFQIYPNHSRILAALQRLGYAILPDILWRKPTNSPNKFLGSGMLPAGAYVTYEHEYILIARKGGKRVFPGPEARLQRRESAFFWEERNLWFSDLWMDIRGSRQELPDSPSRERSAAFPLELPWRLIHMFSLVGDRVLDPFCGTGTTLLAAMVSGRHSVGCDRDGALLSSLETLAERVPSISRQRAQTRLDAHRRFVDERLRDQKVLRHHHSGLDVPVMTSQETDLRLFVTEEIVATSPLRWAAEHSDFAPRAANERSPQRVNARQSTV